MPAAWFLACSIFTSTASSTGQLDLPAGVIVIREHLLFITCCRFNLGHPVPLSLLPPLVPEENGFMSFLSPNHQWQVTDENTKQWPQPVTWPSSFLHLPLDFCWKDIVISRRNKLDQY